MNQRAHPKSRPFSPPFTSFQHSRSKPKQREDEGKKRMEINLEEDIRIVPAHDTAQSRLAMQQAIERANLLYANPPVEAVRKKVRDPEREGIEKNYAAFVGLGYPALKQIHQDVEKYIAEERRDRKGLEFLRFSNRRDLLKIFLIGLTEAKQKKVKPVNAVETVLLKQGTDYLSLMTILAHVTEDYLFKKLYKQNVKPREQPYQVKMQCIRRQGMDKTNFALRRSLINKTTTSDHLLIATEEDLKSEERKEDEKLTIQILVRESQTWQNSEYKKQLKEDKDETVPESARQPQREEEAEDEMQKEYQASVKSAYEVFRRCKRQMQERLRNMAAPMGKKLLRNLEVTMRRQ